MNDVHYCNTWRSLAKSSGHYQEISQCLERGQTVKLHSHYARARAWTQDAAVPRSSQVYAKIG